MKALHQKQLLFIQTLGNGSTIKAAARAAGVTEPTAHNWLKRVEIQQALEEAKAAIQRGRVRVIETVSAENTQAILPRVSEKLQRATEDAVDFLIDLVRDQDARKSDRLKASLELLKISGFQADRNVETQTDNLTSVRPRAGLSAKTSSDIRRQILGLPSEEESPGSQVV